VSGLRISRELTLPIDYVTKTCGILAQRRKGKTYTASVLAEELVAAKQPFVALDPTGAWWGLRSSANGVKAGLPVVILGGRHGDTPLERTDGKFVAELVVDHPGYYVIDFSLFESNEAERQFAADFMERLYRIKGQEGKDFPMHLFIDEADRFAPQRPQPGDQRMLGAAEAIVRRGGLRGLGTTLVSQRAAVVNKNVLEQVDILILLRTVGPNDRKAVDEYVVSHGTDEERKALAGSLSSLELGEAWVWEPGADEPLFDRIHIRERRTFNSSATPKPGEHRVEPKRLAEVDLEEIKKRMAATIERAKASDPKELQALVKRLQIENDRLKAESRPATVEIQTVEVQTLPPGFADWAQEFDQWCVALSAAEGKLQEVFAKAPTMPHTAPKRTPHVPTRTSGGTKRDVEPPRPPVKRSQTLAPPPDTSVTGPQRKLLTILATYGARTKRQLALQGGYSERGGGFNNPLGALRTGGLITRGEPITITDEGLAVLGDYEELPRGRGLLHHWYNQISGPERKILSVLVEEGPELTKAELAERAGYQPTGGGFNNPLGRLRTLGLVDRGDPIRLTDEFAEAIE